MSLLATKVKITIVATICSDEYDNPETMMEELTSEADYKISSTECIEVIDTEWVDTELLSSEMGTNELDENS